MGGEVNYDKRLREMSFGDQEGMDQALLLDTRANEHIGKPWAMTFHHIREDEDVARSR